MTTTVPRTYAIVLESSRTGDNGQKVDELARYELEVDPDEARLLRGMVDDVASVVTLLLNKRTDYGSANIILTGEVGMAARIVDKAARIWNIWTRKDGPAVDTETVEDTLRDLIGYALISLVIERGEQW